MALLNAASSSAANSKESYYAAPLRNLDAALQETPTSRLFFIRSGSRLRMYYRYGYRIYTPPSILGVMDWFRSWHGAPTDAKWLLIARKSGTTPGQVSAVFWALLDYASQHADRGSVADLTSKRLRPGRDGMTPTLQRSTDAMQQKVSSRQMIGFRHGTNDSQNEKMTLLNVYVVTVNVRYIPRKMTL